MEHEKKREKRKIRKGKGEKEEKRRGKKNGGKKRETFHHVMVL